MASAFLLVPILFPIVTGCLLYLLGDRIKKIKAFIAGSVILNSLMIFSLIFLTEEGSFRILEIFYGLDLVLRFDGLGKIFACIIAVLWPVTTFYAFGYMSHENHRTLFYSFFVMTFGVTMGVAASGNLLTLYCFYELLTLVTVPLVMHSMTKEAVHAVRVYLAYCIGGSAFAFLGIIFMYAAGMDISFIPGQFEPGRVSENLLYLNYVIMFLGFGVKAAVFPFHKWLPTASVAPTPVTALLHAVAVVKTGAFAVMRLTYFCYSPDQLRGSWAQYAVMGITLATILFGSCMALRSSHWKKRLAYSTISNLSYILFGVSLMSAAGLTGALMHMTSHAVIKILAFFCAGSVLCMTGRKDIMQLEGMGRKMPLTFGAFMVSALALTGIPPLNGFFSKWSLMSAAFGAEDTASSIGAAVILVSAFLTAMYMIPTAVRAFIPRKGMTANMEGVREAPAVMTVPLLLLSAGTLLMGFFSGKLQELFSCIVSSLI